MYKRTIFKLLNEASIKYADYSYLSQKGENGWNRTSFKDAKYKSIQLASAFLELGVDYEDKVAILSEAKTDWILAEFATLYAGGISVPLSIKLLPDEISFRVNHSDTKLFVISENTLEKVLPQWGNYKNKDLKLIVLDMPSKKISELCKAYNFEVKNLIFIKDYQHFTSEFFLS